MKVLRILCILALCAVPALADPDVTEIRLGTPPPPEEPVDPAKVRAVEGFLAARQVGSLNRDHVSPARALTHTTERLDDATLFGPKDATLAAFNFENESIVPVGFGHFSVSVYLLFANGSGQVVESRDEELVFSHEGDRYVCTFLHAVNVITWTQDGVRAEAASLGAASEFERAERYLADGALGHERLTTYSLADVQKEAGGRVVVQCLRFRSDPGKRGFQVSSTPIVLYRSDDSIRIESN